MKRFLRYLPFLALLGCAGLQRDCSSCNAGSFGADWVVVQYRFDGTPINCWKLQNVGISNEEHSDGIFWQDPSGHLVHISGWYNRVQVNGGNFDAAATAIGVEMARCQNGTYKPLASTPPVRDDIPPPAPTTAPRADGGAK